MFSPKSKALTVATALLLSCASCASGPHSPWEESLDSFSVTFGERQFESADWEPVESPLFVAVNFQFEPETAWVDLDLGLALSRDSTSRIVGGLGLVDLTLEVVEGTAGIYKEIALGDGPISLYAGAGVALLIVDAELADSGATAVFEDEDTSFAPYARVGIHWGIDRNSSIGIDLRHVTGSDIGIGNVSTDVDYTQLGVIFRYIP
ncbi:MAG: hypothetical protein ACI9D0_000486 [Bacteroidia bacterium]|jgi:hypothetical protein